MKKRILSLLLVICLVAVLLPTAAFAEEPEAAADVVKVSTEAELRNAIDAGATSIKLMASFQLTNKITLSEKEITLDLNGFYIASSDYSRYTDIFMLEDTRVGGKTSLTLIDSNPEASHWSNTLPKGGLIRGKITVTVKDGGTNCQLIANGGSVMGLVGLQSTYSSIRCTNDTPTAFYNDALNFGKIYGGIFYGETSVIGIQEPTVTFKYDGSTYAREVVESGKKAVAPIPPQEPDADYHIRWYKEGADFPYDFSTPVTDDITLTAKWENTYILTFDTDGGTEIAPSMYEYNAEVTAPESPTKSGYMFIGWEPEIPETMPMEDITVTAQWMSTSSLGWLGGLLLPLDSMVSYPFVDVPPMYYYFDAVNWAVENGITTGTGRLTFSPDAPCTRAEAVTFLWRAAGCPESKAASQFTDVDANAYYAKAVAWAVENGITNGTSDTTFSPAAVCTRAQIVTFLCRAFGEASGAATPFTDVAADAYYAGAVSWAAANGVTGGTSDTTFSPDAPCTRAQIVTFLYRCFK